MAFKMKGSPFQQMESNAQQRKNLMNDNPVDSKASALNKMDPMHNGEPGVQKEDFEQFSSPMNQGYTDRYNKKGESQSDILDKRTTNRNNYVINKHNKTNFTSEGTLASSKRKIANYDKLQKKSQDSINSVNINIDKKIAKLKNTPKDSPMNQGEKKIPFIKKKNTTRTPRSKKKITKSKLEEERNTRKQNFRKENEITVKSLGPKDGKKKKSPLNNKEERKAERAKRREETGGTRIGNAIRKGKEVVDKVKNSKVGKVASGIVKTVSNVKSGRIGAAIESGKQTISDAKKKKADSPATMKKSKY
tara:strand:+ start:1128 stop:2042 length:915 start_codon:yes stop_codon:yes gene_type:complete